jgi:hypothetical protein
MFMLVVMFGVSVLVVMHDSIKVMVRVFMLDVPRVLRKMSGLFPLCFTWLKPTKYFPKHATSFREWLRGCPSRDSVV